MLTSVPFLLQLLILLTDVVHAQQTISCHAGTGYIGQPANITCTFHKDVKATQTAVSVVMIPFTLRRDEEEREVLQCSWSRDTDKPLCLVTPGYAFDYDATHRLTVAIPHTTRGYAGRYSCHVVPPDGATVQTCELIVTEKIAKTERTINLFPSKQSTEWSTDSGNSMDTPILVLVIVLVLLILPVCIVSLCYAWQNHWISDCTSGVSTSLQRKRKKKGTAEKGEEPVTEDREKGGSDTGYQTPASYAHVPRQPRHTDYERVPEDMLDPLVSTPMTGSRQSNANPPAKTKTPSTKNDRPTNASPTVNSPQSASSSRTLEKQ